MHLRHSLLTTALPFLPSLLAQSNYPNQTGPFNLILTSTTNTTLNGTLLGACHSGAAIESLCVLSGTTTPPSPTDSFTQFYLNTTSLTTPASTILTWNLVGSSFVENEAMSFIYNPTSNLALPLLYPSEEQAQQVQVDSETGELGIALTVDDTVAPPVAVDPTESNGYESVYRWFVCQTYFEGYTYFTLAWRLGESDSPQNPSCQSVRVFVKDVPAEGTGTTYPTTTRKARRGRAVR